MPASNTNVWRGSPGTPYTMSAKAIQHQGKSFPLGSTLVPGGANFSVFAKHSTSAQLLLFDDIDAPKPSRVIDLDPRNPAAHVALASPLAPSGAWGPRPKNAPDVATRAPLVPLGSSRPFAFQCPE